MKKILQLVLVCFTLPAMAQQNEGESTIIKKKGIAISGMVGGNNTFYAVRGIPQRSIPLNFLYTGNLTADLFGKIRVPVSFSWSNQRINFTHPLNKLYRFSQPLNRLVLKPTYKGLTVYLGTAALHFSPYTLEGHRFEGIGLEYKPAGKPFYFGTMAGNLQRAVRIDTGYSVRNNRPSFRRRGWGLMGGLKKGQDKLELIFFTAKDKLNSLPYSLDTFHISPAENAVISLKAEKAFFKTWQAGGELALSGITTDTRTPSSDRGTPFRFFGTLSPKTSTEYLKAMRGFLNYSGKMYQAGFEYTRVDPGYRTLGAYYFNHDLETFSLRVGSILLKSKLSLNVNAGWQRDNLDRRKPMTLKRIVGSVNMAYTPAKNVSMNFSYSSFSSFSNLISSYEYLSSAMPYQYLDTLNFRQLNNNLQANASWKLPSANESRQEVISVMGILQQGTDRQGGTHAINNLSNFNLDYSAAFPKKLFGWNASFFYSKVTFGDMPNTQYGPSAGINKGYGKFKNSLNLFYTSGRMRGVKEKTAHLRYTASYPVKDRHLFRFDAVVLNRDVSSRERYVPDFTECTVTLGYMYNIKIK